MSGTWSRDLPPRFREALQEAKRILSSSSELVSRGVVDTEAEQIVMAVGGYQNRSEFALNLNFPLAAEAAEKILLFATRRVQGEVLQHLLGSQQFLSHFYEVSPAVLVPRPETEVLVLAAVEYLRSEGRAPNVGLEVGLGSGILSIELLAQFPRLRMAASELSPEAAEVARRNALKILGPGPDGADRLTIRMARDASHVFEPFGANDHGDFLISNPPYLQFSDPMDTEVRAREPAMALFAPAGDPHFFYRKMAKGARKRLLKGGRLFLEMPAFRAVEIERIFHSEGYATETLKDLGGHLRVLVAVSQEDR